MCCCQARIGKVIKSLENNPLHVAAAVHQQQSPFPMLLERIVYIVVVVLSFVKL